MKKILIVLVFAICIAPTYSQSINGTVTNASKDVKLSLRTINKRVVKEIPLQGNSFNTSDLEIREGFYKFRKDNNSVYVYLKPDYKLHINFDAKDFNKTVSFSGQGAEANNYLLAKKKILKERWKNSESFYKEGETKYLSIIKSIDKELKVLLNKVNDASFKNNEAINLRFNYLQNLYNYSVSAVSHTGKPVTPSTDFLKPLQELNYNDADLYDQYPSYKTLASDYWHDLLKKAKSFESMDAEFSKISTSQLFVDVIVDAYYRISDTPEKAKWYYQLIEKHVPNQSFVEKAKIKFEKLSTTAIGQKAPAFTFKDRNGKDVSLEDFKGKYVLIDIWATWCTPCLRELPYLKKIEKKYHGKNIAFIGLSVDNKTEYDLWQQTLKDKEMNGIQLFTDKAFESDFVSDFGVTSIPRFILISPEGKIVESHLTKPSNDKTHALLDKLLN